MNVQKLASERLSFIFKLNLLDSQTAAWRENKVTFITNPPQYGYAYLNHPLDFPHVSFV